MFEPMALTVILALVSAFVLSLTFVPALIAIAVTGRVEKCTIVATSKSPSLDAATCAILRTQGRFSPALDLAGHPVASHLIVPVRWVLPES